MKVRYAIITRADEFSEAGKQKIIREFSQNNFIYDELTPELVISIGGDGTLLEAFHQYQHQLENVKFVGVHSGNLGFYTDWHITELDEFIAKVIANNYQTEHFPLLQTTFYFEKETKHFLSLNEITITNYHRTLAMDVYIDDVFFESFRGTGFCVATPSGSTAYNKSLNGALIHPSIPTFQLTEIASINNKVYRTIGSPLILHQNEKVYLKFTDFKDSIVLTNDHLAYSKDFTSFPQEMMLTIAKEKINFARFRTTSFWQRVRRSFIE